MYKLRDFELDASQSIKLIFKIGFPMFEKVSYDIIFFIIFTLRLNNIISYHIISYHIISYHSCYGLNCLPQIRIWKSLLPISQNMTLFGVRIFKEVSVLK